MAPCSPGSGWTAQIEIYEESRISWTLLPVLSKKLENWEKRREAMKGTCRNCHAPDFVSAFYVSFDAAIDLWNTKFALPAQKVKDSLRAPD